MDNLNRYRGLTEELGLELAVFFLPSCRTAMGRGKEGRKGRSPVESRGLQPLLGGHKGEHHEACRASAERTGHGNDSAVRGQNLTHNIQTQSRAVRLGGMERHKQLGELVCGNAL